MKDLVDEMKRLTKERERFERWMRKHCEGIDLGFEIRPPLTVTRQSDGVTTQYYSGIYVVREVQSAWEEWLRAPPKGIIELTPAQLWIGGIVGAAVLAVVVVLIAMAR